MQISEWGVFWGLDFIWVHHCEHEACFIFWGTHFKPPLLCISSDIRNKITLEGTSWVPSLDSSHWLYFEKRHFLFYSHILVFREQLVLFISAKRLVSRIQTNLSLFGWNLLLPVICEMITLESYPWDPYWLETRHHLRLHSNFFFHHS